MWETIGLVLLIVFVLNVLALLVHSIHSQPKSALKRARELTAADDLTVASIVSERTTRGRAKGFMFFRCYSCETYYVAETLAPGVFTWSPNETPEARAKERGWVLTTTPKGTVWLCPDHASAVSALLEEM